jgi:Fe-S cluster assembly scaffold protein SufB
MKLTIFLEKDVQKKIYLKELLSSQRSYDVSNLDLRISIAPNISIDIIDDLIDISLRVTGAPEQIFKNKLEFVLHENSTLKYVMRSIENHMQKTPEQTEKTCTIDKELIFTLAGKNCRADAVSSCFAQDNRVYKFKTLQDHQVPGAISNVTIKAVLDDQAKITCNGMIRVAKDAHKTDAYLLNKNILLSKKARAVSIPQLEIEANDVKCKHGAAVSRLDDEQMFYMKSRGIGDALTRSLLIEAFLS